MMMTLHLPVEFEQRVVDEAGRRGVAPNEFVLHLLRERLTAWDKSEQLAALLESWTNEDRDEQRTTFEYLVAALNENRFMGRKLFPPEMKGITACCINK
jgi:hypothetical protein